MAVFILFLTLVLLIIVFIVRPFSTLIHELGHAIPAILLTKEKVSIYIGSYGDPKKSLNFTLGRLEVWFRYDPFSWQLGLCVPSAKDISTVRKIIYILSGPLASLLISFFAIYFLFFYDFHGAVKLLLMILLGSSIFDFFANLIPQSRPIQLYDGDIVYNDGRALQELFHFRKFEKEYIVAVQLYRKEKYKEAAPLFNEMLKKGRAHEYIFRLAISSLVRSNAFQEAKEVADKFIAFGNVSSDDYVNIGLTYSQLKMQEEAIQYYDESLRLNPDNKYSLNNKGYSLMHLAKFEESIPLFDKAIEVDSGFDYPYNNRGYAKYKMGKENEGLRDIRYALELNEKNSYAIRNLGIYHLDKAEYAEALRLFERAKELDHTTEMIEDLISKASTH
jgi:Tfp pilus assembly protein PilF